MQRGEVESMIDGSGAADVDPRRARWETLDAAAAGPRMAWLADELHRHNHLYHTVGQAEIDDREYDLLFQELTALEAKRPLLASPDSPTRRVGGAPVGGLTPFVHRQRMLSLGNVFSARDLQDFEARSDDTGRITGGLRLLLQRAQEDPDQAIVYIVEPKLDGLSVELVY